MELLWRALVVSLAWLATEFVRDAIAVGLRQVLHADPFGQVLPNQPVHVVVGATFPRMMQRREVEFERQPCFNGFVAVELCPIMRGDRAHQWG